MKYNLNLTFSNILHQTFCFKEIGEVIAPQEERLRSFWVLWVTVGTRRDWNMVIAETRAENKWEKEFFYCQIEEGQRHKCMTSTRVTVYYSQFTQGTDAFS